MLMQKSVELQIDLNAKNESGITAFYSACLMGRTETVEKIIENADYGKIDLKAQNRGMTGFQIAEMGLKFQIVDLIRRKLPVGKY